MRTLSNLPPRPLTESEVHSITCTDKVVEGRPQFVEVDTPTVLGMLLILENGNTTLVCFDPNEDEWVQVMNQPIDDEKAIDSDLDDAFEWMDERYGSEGYATVGTL